MKFLVLAMGLFLIGCESPPIAVPPRVSPAASLPTSVGVRLDTVKFTYLIAYPDQRRPTEQSILALIRKTAPRLLAASGPLHVAVNPTQITEIGKNSDDEILRFVESAERKILQSKAIGLDLQFSSPTPESAQLLLLANHISLALARSGGGIILDDTTGMPFSAKFWRDSYLQSYAGKTPLVSAQTVRTYTKSQVETAGMEKFALPNLRWKGITGAFQTRALALLCEIQQLLVETTGSEIPQSLVLSPESLRHPECRRRFAGARAADAKPTKISFRRAEDGFLEIDLSEVQGETEEERSLALLLSAFGGRESAVVTKHDEELLAASSRGKKLYREQIRPRLKAKLRERERVMVEAPFPIRNGREWLWVEVDSLQGKTLSGTTIDDAEAVPNLPAGSRVVVKEDEIFDALYIVKGRTFGGETKEIINRRASHPL